MLNATWITLAVVLIVGVTKLLTYLLGARRRKRQLREMINELEKELRAALVANDTIRISTISAELSRLRDEYSHT